MSITEQTLRAAAKWLFDIGNHHHWWVNKGEETFEEWEKRDPIGFEEFLDIVDRVVRIGTGIHDPTQR